MIALGVISASSWLGAVGPAAATRRHVPIALCAVPAGLIGAALPRHHRQRAVPGSHWVDASIWRGGLGIPGGIIAGVGVGVWVGHRKGIRLPPGLDTVGPPLALAQAIGRWGNYFNVELFGSPTSLPWGLEVPMAKRPLGYEQATTFHPTFLYESLWNFGLVLVLIWIDRKRVLRPGRIFALYIGGYFTGRFGSSRCASTRPTRSWGSVNTWMSWWPWAAWRCLLIGGVRRRPATPTSLCRRHRWDPAGVVPAPCAGLRNGGASANRDTRAARPGWAGVGRGDAVTGTRRPRRAAHRGSAGERRGTDPASDDSSLPPVRS
jgi:prolipoprotein diacylglyceryltransferase